MKSLKNTVKSLKTLFRNESGNVSIFFALGGVPLLMAVGVAIDSQRIAHTKAELQSVADVAAIAAVSAKGTIEERKAAGEAFLVANKSKMYGVDYDSALQVDADSATVQMNSQVKGTLTKVAFALNKSSSAGDMSVPIIAKAVKETKPGYSICVFSTSEDAENAIYLYGTGVFTAAGCSLYANSSDAAAVHVQGNKDVITEGIHSLGGLKVTGGSGNITGEFVKATETVADPFNIVVDDEATPTGDDVSASKNVTLDKKFYNDISIKKGTATFTPGVHYITGELSVSAQGKIFGNGVTLVLVGKNARLRIQSGGVIDITAPRADQLPDGEKQFAGFAVYGYTNDDGDLSNYANILLGGAGSNIRGIVYTPNQDLEVSGNSGFNVDSKYSPLVANKITLGGNGSINIGLDYAAYGFAKPEVLFIPEVSIVHLVK